MIGLDSAIVQKCDDEENDNVLAFDGCFDASLPSSSTRLSLSLSVCMYGCGSF